jgi:hypothetical protein
MERVEQKDQKIGKGSWGCSEQALGALIFLIFPTFL